MVDVLSLPRVIDEDCKGKEGGEDVAAFGEVDLVTKMVVKLWAVDLMNVEIQL